MKTNLKPVIKVDDEKCKNCHACIAACPVKICMDGSGDKIIINHDLCIGCGKCISACHHDARGLLDDVSEFFSSVNNKEDVIAIVAPAAAAVFKDDFLKFNTYLKNLGVKAVFDVSFGAELTIKSYLEYLKQANPQLIISQPCPAIVSYIELYKPELLKYLAPADSPMLHTLKMIKEYYPQYRKHKTLVVSPCPAKKREFDETGFNVYNVTLASFKKMLEQDNINLKTLPETDFDNPPAERAVLFSTPGGLLETAMRIVPDIKKQTRKIEGPDIIYHYLNNLPESVKDKTNPLLVDCLNCELGCNGGPGTGNADKSPDEIEYYVNQRSKKLINYYGNSKKSFLKKLIPGRKNIEKIISKYWKENLYKRTYIDASDNGAIITPTPAERDKIYKSMLKYSEEDIIDCCACGYYSCEMMATAIHNGLNRAQNCNFYREQIIGREREYLEQIYTELREKAHEVNIGIDQITGSVEQFIGIIMEQVRHIGESSSAVNQLIAIIQDIASKAEKRKLLVDNLTDKVVTSETDLKETINAMNIVTEAVSGVYELTELINAISDNTNLLSLNAAIEAAHAGSFGKGFAVVADEIRKLARSSSENSDKISETLKKVDKHVTNSRQSSEKSSVSMQHMMVDIKEVANIMTENIYQMQQMSAGSVQITSALGELQTLTENVKQESEKIMKNVREIKYSVNELAEISKDDSMKELLNLNEKTAAF